ncbi:secreted RxLR effector protein 161-like [Cicer arietinum]|uniref:secreted RxLR effector protein 161-like n=1 Tax=Cicer arietinum TaxID=3827 RepID=UPI003CC6647B
MRYLCNTRPDISYSVGLISRFIEKPRTSHYMEAKRILRYIKETIELGLLYSRKLNEEEVELISFTDADWCGDMDDRKSTAGYVFTINNSPISWCSKKQNIVALSICEAEYVVASMGACQAMWLTELMAKLELRRNNAVKMKIDNKSAIDLARHPSVHRTSKHIETRFYFLRDQVMKGNIKLKHCNTNYQKTDILTKSLKRVKFEEMKIKLGLTLN